MQEIITCMKLTIDLNLSTPANPHQNKTLKAQPQQIKNHKP